MYFYALRRATAFKHHIYDDGLKRWSFTEPYLWSVGWKPTLGNRLWLNDWSRLFGEAKEIRLDPLLPLVHDDRWVKFYLAIHCFTLLSFVDGDPRYVCNAWKKKNIPFSQEILLTYFYELCNKMQVNVLGVLITMCYSSVFHAMLMDYDLDWLPSFDSRLVTGQIGASCLRHVVLEG